MPSEVQRLSLSQRPRRLRRTEALRRMARETVLVPGDLVQPLFVIEGKGQREPIASMPGQARLSVDVLVEEARHLARLGISGVALFPRIDDAQKDELGTESTHDGGLVPRAVKALKDAVPELMVICDVALDPFTSTGQDGIVVDGEILNDRTVAALVEQALCEARAGADIVAPSDMMDGRIGAIRHALDENGFEQVAILSYAAKYASSFYGPFRDALDSAPRGGADKKTYQMDPGNLREAEREVLLDVEQGADIVMVKPALPYLDVLRRVRECVTLPVAAYHVSGEYAMLKAAGQNGWLDEKKCMDEALLCIKRAGADVIFTYAAREFAERQ
ncbi:MAG: porphobilinogen synthase [Myxococcota bacterium]